MIVEVDAASKTAEILAEIGRIVMGRAEVRKPKRTLLDPIMSRMHQAQGVLADDSR